MTCTWAGGFGRPQSGRLRRIRLGTVRLRTAESAERSGRDTGQSENWPRVAICAFSHHARGSRGGRSHADARAEARVEPVHLASGVAANAPGVGQQLGDVAVAEHVA
jgi:hypothetical protein